MNRKSPQIQVFVLGLALTFTAVADPGARPRTTAVAPLRLGLWEEHHTQTLNGLEFQVPPFVIEEARRRGVAMSDDGLSERFCLTADNIASLGMPSATGLPACRKESVDVGDIGMNVTFVCGDATGSGRGSIGVAFDSPTAYHGRFAFTGTHQLFGNLPMTVAGPVNGHWLQSSCTGRPP